MSIAHAEVAPEHDIKAYLLWLFVALCVLFGSRLRHRCEIFAYRRRATDSVPALAGAAMVVFVVWLLVQIVLRDALQANAGPTPVTTLAPLGRAILAIAASLAGLLVALRFISRRGMAGEIGLTWRGIPAGLGQGLVGAIVAIPIVQGVVWSTLKLWHWLGIDHARMHDLLQAMRDEPTWTLKLAVIIAAVVMAPLFEEVLFRGLVQSTFRNAFGRPWLAILIASVIFGVVHALWTAPSIFVLALLMGLIYERTGNLWSAIVMHALFNAYAIATSGPP